MKIAISYDDLKVLAVRAKAAGIQDIFIDLCLEWAEAAESEIERLTASHPITPRDLSTGP